MVRNVLFPILPFYLHIRAVCLVFSFQDEYSTHESNILGIIDAHIIPGPGIVDGLRLKVCYVLHT